MGVYQDQVRNIFNQQQQGINIQTGANKLAGASRLNQANLAGGVTGPAATSILGANQRAIGSEANQQLLNLGTEQNKANVAAFGQDRADQIAAENAKRAKEQQFMTGLGNTLGAVGSLFAPGISTALGNWVGNLGKPDANAQFFEEQTPIVDKIQADNAVSNVMSGADAYHKQLALTESQRQRAQSTYKTGLYQ